VLGTGEITRAVTVSAHRFSEAAKQKIVAAGGKVIELAVKAAKAE
jgi:large subunit ribosomal protein L15